jgi:hypothetical protein
VNIEEEFKTLIRLIEAANVSPKTKKKLEKEKQKKLKQEQKEWRRKKAIEEFTPKPIPPPPAIQITPSTFRADLKR